MEGSTKVEVLAKDGRFEEVSEAEGGGRNWVHLNSP